MKDLQLLLVKLTVRIFYFLFRILRVKKRFVFASYRSEKLTDNYLFMTKFINEETNIPTVYLFKKFSSSFFNKIFYYVHMVKVVYFLATSSYFIIDDFYLPVYLIKNKRMKTNICMVWHACGALKKFGLSTLNYKYGANRNYLKKVPIHTNYDAVFISSSKVIPYYYEAFHVAREKYHGLGIPRVDLFYDTVYKLTIKERFYQEFPQLRNKLIILFCPTFRGTGQTSATYEIEFCIEDLVEQLKQRDDYFVLIKHHPFVTRRIEVIDKIYSNLFKYMDESYHVNDLMIICDVMITDYSSTIFEYSLLNKPLYLFAPDYDEYIKERDFYIDYKKLLPRYTFNQLEQIIDSINHDDYDLSQLDNIRENNFDYFDPFNTQRVVEKILELNKR